MENPDKTLLAITNLARERDARRASADAEKRRRAFESKTLSNTSGAPKRFGDVDFVGMIDRYRAAHAGTARSHDEAVGSEKICVVVRKRPSSDRERDLLDHDAVTCFNPIVTVHSCKLKVDGITKYLENTSFEFDHAFEEAASNEEVYNATCAPLVEFAVMSDGRATVFAYGQTGSGKTHTMEGLQQRAARDIFAYARARSSATNKVLVRASLFELYGPQCLDLLNERRVCAVREDGQGDVHIEGLVEEEAEDEDSFMEILARGAAQRTTRCTEMNADSSRSHAIFQVTFSSGGKLSLIDLAGSERGQDTKNHDATRRSESAAINKSLLALKECIRALDPKSGATRIPYRGSKLTMVLKDSFADHSRTVMISCVAPAASSADHTLNTLRYADRIKEKVVGREPPSNAAPLPPKSPGPLIYNRPKSLGGSSSTAAPAPFAGTSNPKVVPANHVGGHVLLGGGGAPPPSGRSKSPGPIARVSHPVVATTSVVAEQKQQSFDEDDDDGLSAEHIKLLRQAASRQQQQQQQVAYRPQASEEDFPPPPPPFPPPVAATATRSNPSNFAAAPIVSAPPAPVANTPSVTALIDEEEQLLAAHMDAIQMHGTLLAREGKILARVQGTVDYDVEEYCRQLDDLLNQQMQLCRSLSTRLNAFREHLRAEEDAVTRL